jgi:hypothetical protein
VRDTFTVILLVEGDGRLGPSVLCQGSEGVDDIHLLLGDVALPVGLICLGGLEDHEATIGLRKLSVILRGGVRLLAGLGGRLLSLPY